ncbi:hypothetical protein HWI79_2858 [Cryptosporidium felis]|nr:hypothetical protein HWI79_2858 [Cryptosporidium felis]
MTNLGSACICVALILLKSVSGGNASEEYSGPDIFEEQSGSGEISGTLGVLNFNQNSMEGSIFDTQEEPQVHNSLREDSQSFPKDLTIGDMFTEKKTSLSHPSYGASVPELYETENSFQYEDLRTPGKRRGSQKRFSMEDIFPNYSREQLSLLNEFHLAFSLLVRKGLKKFIFKKYSPSHIRSTFAKKYVERFGGTKSKALVKLREFEKKLGLKHSAAKKLFVAQANLLKSTLNSFEAVIHLSQIWRNQPIYINEPIMVVNKSSFSKLRKICRSKSKKITILFVSASTELVPKKFHKPDLNESVSNLSVLGKTLQSLLDSISLGEMNPSSRLGKTQCRWGSSKKGRSRSLKKRLTCFSSPKQKIFHIHYYDVSNVRIFNRLIQNLHKYKSSPYARSPVQPLIIVPILMGIPQIGRQGLILGLNSIVEVSRNRRSKKSKKSSDKRR